MVVTRHALRFGLMLLCSAFLAACGDSTANPSNATSAATADPLVPTPNKNDISALADDGDHDVTFIHTGDFHGALLSHPNARGDSVGMYEGGLARVHTVINSIRARNDNTFYVHSGDTISGGAEATFTRGQAMVDIVNKFGIDAYVPGNWEFGYGVDRFLELFAGRRATANWRALSANAYYTGGEPYTTQVPGTRLLPAYRVTNVNGIKIGMFACTTNRGPTIVSSNITKGVAFSACTGTTLNAGTPQEVIIPPEIPYFVDLLRNQEKVDLVILISELGLAENLWNAERYDGIDIIFSSDMHEETKVPVLVTTPNGKQTVVIEEGEDGEQVGELNVKVVNHQLASWQWTAHEVNASVPEDPVIAALVDDAREPFVAGDEFVPGRFVNPYNGAKLIEPIDKVIGYTKVTLSRNQFSNDPHPALIEGNAHDLLADAFRAMTGAQIGGIRGFRYNYTIAPGPITYEDIYHYMPIGPQIAVAEITGNQLNRHAENAAASCMEPDVTTWAGGWMFNFSGLTFDLDPYQKQTLTPISVGRVFNLMLDSNGDGVGDVAINDSDSNNYFTYASYFYADDPKMVNRIAIDTAKLDTIKVLVKDGKGNLTLVPPTAITPDNVVDGSEVVARYLASLPEQTVTDRNLPFPRIHLAGGKALPDTTAKLGFPMIEPVYGMDLSKY